MPGSRVLVRSFCSSPGLSELQLASAVRSSVVSTENLWAVPRAEDCPRGRDAFAVGGESLETSLKLWQAGALPGEPRAPGNIYSDAQKSVEAAARSRESFRRQQRSRPAVSWGG